MENNELPITVCVVCIENNVELETVCSKPDRIRKSD